MEKSVAHVRFFSPLGVILLLWATVFNPAEAKCQRNLIKDSVSVFVSNLDPYRFINSSNVVRLRYSNSDKTFNFGLTGPEYHCIILKVTAEMQVRDHYLSIDNTSLDTVMIYKIEKNGNVLVYSGGMLVAYKADRTYVWHCVPLEINNAPSYYLIALKAPQKNINFQYKIQDEDQLQKSYEQYERFVFFFIGIASMIATIITVALLLFKKIVFAAYFGYVVCASTWIIAHYGHFFPFVYPQLPVVNNILKPITSLGAAFFLLVVLRCVFQANLLTHRRFGSMLQFMQYGIGILGVLMFLLSIQRLNATTKAILVAAWHFGLLVSVCMIIVTPLVFYRTGALAKIFSSAMVVISLTTVVQLFANAGLIRNYFINEHGMAMGTIIENSIMAFGLFYGLLVEGKNKQVELLSMEEQQNQTLKKLIAVQDDERKRIAADLHDNIGPLLAALKINFRRMIDAKDQQQQSLLLDKTENIVDESILEIRNVAHNLMPKGLSSNGLINTLAGYFDDIGQLYNKQILFQHNVQSVIPADCQMNIYRVISELVLNAAKYSSAESIHVSISAEGKNVSILVYDDGQGFEIKAGERQKSLGIQSAESRVHFLKGHFELRSEIGKGTTIRIQVPL